MPLNTIPAFGCTPPFGNESAANLQAAVPLNISSTVGGQPDAWTILLTVQCDRVFISKKAGHLVHIIPVAEGTSTENGAQRLTPGQSFHEAGLPPLDFGRRSDKGFLLLVLRRKEMPHLRHNLSLQEKVDFQSFAAASPCSLLISFFMCIRIYFAVTLNPLALFVRISVYSCFSKRGYLPGLGFTIKVRNWFFPISLQKITDCSIIAPSNNQFFRIVLQKITDCSDCCPFK